jgi:GT2 family glycosyltransferase
VTAATVVVTVRNEAASVPDLLRSLDAQLDPPAETIVVDGGSTDETFDLLVAAAGRRPGLRVLRAPGANISQGRNQGIGAATTALVATTDAGTTLAPDWLAQLVGALEREPPADVAVGFFRPAGHTRFERALSTIVLPHPSEVSAASPVTSARSLAFRRDRWAEVGGFPEWLDHCEDVVFGRSLRDAGAVFRFVPEAEVTWSARPHLGAFFRQYFLYARGDGRAALYPARHAARYAAYVAGVALAFAARRHVAARPVRAAGVVAHLAPYVRRVVRRPPEPGVSGRLYGLALVPVVVITGDVAKMLGYPVGVLLRRRGG